MCARAASARLPRGGPRCHAEQEEAGERHPDADHDHQRAADQANHRLGDSKGLLLPASTPLPSGQLNLGSCSSNRHYWVTMHSGAWLPDDVRITLPAVSLNGVVTGVPELRFHRRSMAGTGLFASTADHGIVPSWRPQSSLVGLVVLALCIAQLLRQDLGPPILILGLWHLDPPPRHRDVADSYIESCIRVRLQRRLRIDAAGHKKSNLSTLHTRDLVRSLVHGLE